MQGEQSPIWKKDRLLEIRYWTNDSSLNSAEKVKSVIYLGRGNLIFDNLADAVQQLRQTGNYRPTEEIAYEFKRAPTTIRANHDDLGLKRHDDEFCYFVIRTLKGRDGLSSIQAAVAEKPFGQAEDFEDNMKMLYDAGVNEARVWILNPEYVKKMNEKGGPIARAGWLGGFGGDSRFGAVDRVVDDPYDALRGVSRRSAEGAPQIPEVLDERTTLALKAGQAFQYQGNLYVPVSNNVKIDLG